MGFRSGRRSLEMNEELYASCIDIENAFNMMRQGEPKHIHEKEEHC